MAVVAAGNGRLVRLGVVGCGNVSLNRHLPAIREQAADVLRLVAAADPTPARLELYRAAAGLEPRDCVADPAALLARADLDAVVVATPPAYRPALVRAALAAGKHVLSEKPLALVPAEAWDLARTARSAGRHLALMHNYRFQAPYATAKRVLESGQIGRPYLVTLNFLGVEDLPGATEYQPLWRHDPGAAGGGVLMDMHHAIYLAECLMGQAATAVSAAVDRRLSPAGPVEDAALCRYEFGHGFAQVNVAWGHGPGGLEISAADGRLLLFFRAFGTGPFQPPEQLHVFRGNERLAVDFDPSPDRGFGATLRDFGEAIAAGREPAAPAEEGCRTLEGVLGAYASGLLGRRVSLPLETTDPVYREGFAGLARLEVPADSPAARQGLFGLDGED